MALRPALPVAVALGRRRFSAPTLSPAPLSHPFCCPSLAVSSRLDTGPNSGLEGLGGSFPYPGGKSRTQALTGRRNPMLFRRKRRVLCTRGFLSDQATGLVLHTGPNGGQQGASRSGLLLGTKTAAGFCLAAALGVMIGFAEDLRFLPHPPARKGISAAGNPPAPW